MYRLIQGHKAGDNAEGTLGTDEIPQAYTPERIAQKYLRGVTHKYNTFLQTVWVSARQGKHEENENKAGGAGDKAKRALPISTVSPDDNQTPQDDAEDSNFGKCK